SVGGLVRIARGDEPESNNPEALKQSRQKPKRELVAASGGANPAVQERRGTTSIRSCNSEDGNTLHYRSSTNRPK
ncbi:hypothetical protein A2U01_0027782, partial [Trifolium medium]|nr:hypothetical protein [Trifolium medium]